jgi:hypothetical protein
MVNPQLEDQHFIFDVFFIQHNCGCLPYLEAMSSMKTAVSEVLAPSITRTMMVAARTFETMTNFYKTTWWYNPQESHLCIHHRENLKSNTIHI